MENSILSTLKLMKKISTKRAVVIGDIVLDEYVFGKVNKVSTGIQIPIIEKERIEYRLGGAANVAANVAGLCKTTFLMGKCGNDNAGTIINKICEDQGIVLYNYGSMKTIVKERIYIDNQQVSRLDTNFINSPITEDLDTILTEIKADVMIVADYLYGVISQELIEKLACYAKLHNIPLLFTSREVSRYCIDEIPILVLNQKEWGDYYKRLEDSDQTALIAGKEWFVTLGGQGIRYLSSSNEIEQKTSEKYPVNVSGAGDTVIAVISLFYGEEIEMEDLLVIANMAGGMAVTNELTYTISKYELIDALYERTTNLESQNKIVNLDLAIDIIHAWKKEGKQIVFTNGCYDLLHLGHIKSFQYAKQFGDKLIVAVNSDASIKRLKGEDRPVNCLEERVGMLSYLGMIDMVITFDEDTAITVMKGIEPDTYIKGEEYKNRKLLESEYAKRIEYVPMIEAVSTTHIIKKIVKAVETGE